MWLQTKQHPDSHVFCFFLQRPARWWRVCPIFFIPCYNIFCLKSVFQRKLDFRPGLEEKGTQKSEFKKAEYSWKTRTALLEKIKRISTTLLMCMFLQYFGSIRFLSCKLSSVWNCKFRHFTFTFKAPSDGYCIECAQSVLVKLIKAICPAMNYVRKAVNWAFFLKM